MLISRGTLVFVIFTSDVIQVVSSYFRAKDGIFWQLRLVSRFKGPFYIKKTRPVGERPPPRLSNKKELSVPRAEKTPEPWPRPNTRSGHRGDRYLGRCWAGDFRCP
jgi:hypothetical protein